MVKDIPQVYEYIHAPHLLSNGKTVHLSRQKNRYWTLCSKKTGGMVLGKETLSGKAATCDPCRKVIGLPTLEPGWKQGLLSVFNFSGQVIGAILIIALALLGIAIISHLPTPWWDPW
jgi:hypothetical protein